MLGKEELEHVKESRVAAKAERAGIKWSTIK
jgi:hypothetical protein